MFVLSFIFFINEKLNEMVYIYTHTHIFFSGNLSPSPCFFIDYSLETLSFRVPLVIIYILLLPTYLGLMIRYKISEKHHYHPLGQIYPFKSIINILWSKIVGMLNIQ